MLAFLPDVPRGRPVLLSHSPWLGRWDPLRVSGCPGRARRPGPPASRPLGRVHGARRRSESRKVDPDGADFQRGPRARGGGRPAGRFLLAQNLQWSSRLRKKLGPPVRLGLGSALRMAGRVGESDSQQVVRPEAGPGQPR